MTSLVDAAKTLVRSNPRLYWALRSAWIRAGSLAPPRDVGPRVPGRIHRNDLMFEPRRPDAVAGYSHTGQQPLAFLREAVAEAGGTFEALGSFLDFGCGHGRVLRYVRQALPQAAITACDLDSEAIMFCATEFGAAALPSYPDLDRVRLAQHDLAWMGSVLTHVDESTCNAIVRKLTAALNPQGFLAFSSHGDYSLEHVADFLPGLPDTSFTAELADAGIAYRAYAHYGRNGYGLTWHADAFFQDLPTRLGLPLTLVKHSPSAWGGGKQDLWLFQKD